MERFHSQDRAAARQGLVQDSRIGGPVHRPRRPRTIAEQIADEVGAEIIEGLFGPNQRVGEQELAERYSVSRGPVREAIRILERRGLVEFFPRRGAFAIELSFDLIADIFNLQGNFLGLAARYFSRCASPEGYAAVEREIEVLRVLQRGERCDPIEFALQNGRVGISIKRNCGNDHLLRIVRSVAEESLWGFMWHQRPLDYLTVERREQGIAQWEALLDAARRGEDRRAERIAQQILFDSRDSAVAVLQHLREGTQDKRRLLNNVQSRPDGAG